MRRKTRLFALAEAMRARRTGVTAQQLADRFGVTIRTIYRDLDALQDAGMPIKADRGRGGGYALDKNYQLPPINFTAREAALLVAMSRFVIEQRRLLDLVDAKLPILIGLEIDDVEQRDLPIEHEVADLHEPRRHLPLRLRID